MSKGRRDPRKWFKWRVNQFGRIELYGQEFKRESRRDDGNHVWVNCDCDDIEYIIEELMKARAECAGLEYIPVF